MGIFKRTIYLQYNKGPQTIKIRKSKDSSGLLNPPLLLFPPSNTHYCYSFSQTRWESQQLRHSKAHCSFLDIYISRKIRLCVVDLQGKFQTNLLAKPINFLVWKFKSIILIFLLFFAEFVKSTAFYTLLLLFQRVDMFELWFLHQIAIQTCQLFGIAATVCKKHWIWQILRKIEEKWV